jgi:hypothetical protein
LNILTNRFNRKPKSKKAFDGLTKGNVQSKANPTLREFGIEILGVLLLAIIITFMFPRGKSFQFADLKEGRVYIGSEIIAPFTFPVNKSSEEYAADRKKARDSVPPVFNAEPKVADRQQDALVQFVNQLDNALKSSETSIENLEILFRDRGVVVSEEDLYLLLTGFAPPESKPDIPVSSNVVKKRTSALDAIQGAIIPAVRELYSIGILDIDKSNFPLAQKISISKGQQDMVEELEDIQFYQGYAEAQNTLLEKLREESDLEERKVKIAYQIAVHFLEPNLLYDREEHQVRIKDALANVPLAKDQVLAGERIIDSHERVSKQHIEKLNSLAIAKAERGETMGFWASVVPIIGKFFITLFILSILIIFLWRANYEILKERKKLLLIALVILSIAMLTFLVNHFALSPYVIPVAMGTIIITIFFNANVGLVSAVVMSLLVGAMRGNEYGITFISVFASSLIILTVSKVRTRNWVLFSMGVTILAYIFAISVHDILSYVTFSDMAENWVYGLANGFLAPIFAYGLIIIFEFAFDMTTDMTLLELSDLNQPLLRQLAMTAPGTYHHSIVVGNLSESAAEAIGGNALLARVGAYYHDIGKMEKPEYFVENQSKGRNPQEGLTPSMSSLILLNHVRKGAEMARIQGLPSEVERFIYEHHGTGLMSYFYQKALEQSEGDPVSANEYRYPGPKPTSKETAIVMLADAVEATSRTLKDPTPSRIKNMVETLIDERFKSGELDHSPLTLQDLSKISEAFQKILNGIFHGRIDYPATKETSAKTTSKNKAQAG